MTTRAGKLVLLAGAAAALAAAALAGLLKGERRAPFRTREAERAADGYTVTMSPMGPVTFARVPRRIVTQDANYNDMLVLLGEGEHLAATGFQNNEFHGYYRDLPRAEQAIDYQAVQFLSKAGGYGIDKETLYALHGDVHHIDPVVLASSKGWSREDVAEIARNVGPFFANRYSRDDNYAGAERYDYYDVWGLSGKVAEVYQRPERVAGLKAIYDGMVARIQARLPPGQQRPRVAVVIYQKAGFLAFALGSGFGAEQYRAVGAVDAFAAAKVPSYRDGPNAARLDLEGMLSIDPDVIITNFGVLPGMSHNHELLLALKGDPLAMRLKAFRDDRLYPGGTPLQGPLFLLFQTEMAAKQIYPALFGAYRGDQRYPAEEQLFDRAQVAAVLASAPAGAK